MAKDDLQRRFGGWFYKRTWALSDWAHARADLFVEKHGKEQVDEWFRRVDRFIDRDMELYVRRIEERVDELGERFLELGRDSDGPIERFLDHPAVNTALIIAFRIAEHNAVQRVCDKMSTCLENMTNTVRERAVTNMHRAGEFTACAVVSTHLERGTVITLRGELNAQSEALYRQMTDSAPEKCGTVLPEGVLAPGVTCLVLSDPIMCGTHYEEDSITVNRAWRNSRVLILANGARFYVYCWDLLYAGWG